MSALAVDTAVVEIHPWEVHSELVLVCPDVCRRALELLPDRDPDAFLVASRRPLDAADGAVLDQHVPAVPLVAARYALWRLGQTVQFALLAGGVLFALACLAEVMH